MRIQYFIVLTMALALTGCANPLNRATSDNYAETCALAEATDQLYIAEEACYRALVNVDMGNLGSEIKSQRLYNLGRIKRQLGKFSESEQLLNESLAIEMSLTDTVNLKIGRRLVELAVSLAAQNKWKEGSQYLIPMLPIVGHFTEPERAYISQVLMGYSERLATTENTDLARLFSQLAAKLQ